MGGEERAAQFNLLKTVIGSGIVSYPSFFASFGIVPALGLSFFSAVLAFAGLMMLCECALFYGTKKKTFSESLEDVWPGIAKYFDAIVFIKCFGVSISYLVILKRLLFYVATKILGFSNVTQGEVIILYAAMMFPACILKDLRSLRFTSVVGVVGVVVCICGGAYNLWKKMSAEALPEMSAFEPVNWEWIKKSGQFVFSFTCHQNIFSIRSGLENPSRKKMGRVIGSVMGAALLMYLSFGLVVYATYGKNIEDNVFMSFSKGAVKKFVILFYTVLLSCSYPLQIYPARVCLYEQARKIGRGGGERYETVLQSLCAAFLISVGVLVTFMSVDIGMAQSIIGGTASAIMCNLIPSVCFLKLPRKKSALEKSAAVLLFLYALVAFAGVCAIFM